MHVDPLERRWFILSGLLMLAITLVLTAYAVGGHIHPPSNVEAIDSTQLHLTEEFAEENLGVQDNANGTLTVTMVAARYGFFPPHVEVPAGTPVTFRWASADVLHGVHVPFSNMSTMVVPGYVSEVTTQFDKPGEYPFLCNEYCGLGHDFMWSRLTVTTK
jgi:cytochrome c oxidase subunit 2